MKAPVISRPSHDDSPIARLNHAALREAGIFTVSVSGGPGCGKTTLLDATIPRLAPLRVGVIACDVASHVDADRMTRDSDQVVQVNTGDGGTPDASHIHEALQWLDLDALDLLFIENVGALLGPVTQDLGQDVTAALFSVAGGHDKAAKHPDLVKGAGIVLLNKIDLLNAAPFDLAAFRADVARLNPRAELIEVSALRGDGLDRWVEWLEARIPKPRQTESQWFG